MSRAPAGPLDWLFAALSLAFVASIALLPYPGDFLLKVSPVRKEMTGNTSLMRLVMSMSNEMTRKSHRMSRSHLRSTSLMLEKRSLMMSWCLRR